MCQLCADFGWFGEPCHRGSPSESAHVLMDEDEDGKTAKYPHPVVLRGEIVADGVCLTTAESESDS